ncbi:hypothetical protein PVAP13_9NG208373 [Panicum virgatum]|uniref:Uncharacterized protein n=1 Tax=Panicum virgatum TaxID=38727 RepID=A0A8T0MI11_PANVG|nr:hypothetical protein PVAP13_9NG208373 [Panicum virgatum]
MSSSLGLCRPLAGGGHGTDESSLPPPICVIAAGWPWPPHPPRRLHHHPTRKEHRRTTAPVLWLRVSPFPSSPEAGVSLAFGAGDSTLFLD